MTKEEKIEEDQPSKDSLNKEFEGKESECDS